MEQRVRAPTARAGAFRKKVYDARMPCRPTSMGGWRSTTSSEGAGIAWLERDCLLRSTLNRSGEIRVRPACHVA